MAPKQRKRRRRDASLHPSEAFPLRGGGRGGRGGGLNGSHYILSDDLLKQKLDQVTAEWVKANVHVVKRRRRKFLEDHGLENMDKCFDKLLRDIVKEAWFTGESADLRDEEFRLSFYETRFDASDGQPLFQFVERHDFPKTRSAINRRGM